MSTTFAILKTELSEALRDPDLSTFDDPALGRLVNMALSEIGRIAPFHFQEDIAPVVDTLDYQLQSDYFDGVQVAEVEVVRVELWDASVTPNQRMAVIPSAASGVIADSEAGWSNWGGSLHIPYRVWTIVDGSEEDRLYRVWGYCPYAQLVLDADVFDGSDELKWAIITYAQIVATRRLVSERELFTQWQTRSGNTDTSLAGLMGDLTRQRDEWRIMKRDIYRHRVKV